MTLKLRPVAEIAAKWAKRAGAAVAELEAGLKSPTRDWASETKAAEGAYEDGIQEALSRKAFGKGVDKAGTKKWQAKSIDLGKDRFAAGVRAAQNDFQTEFAPFRDALERIALPERGKRGDPANIQRVVAIAEALHAERVK